MATATTPTLLEIPITSVYPDPFQPRLHPDTELADSLRSVGQLQPIRVELAEPLDAIDERTGKTFTQIAAESGYMIQDGERRWRGSLEAGKRTIMAVVVPPATEGARLVRQLVSNTGKPLTPIEEARAYKRLMTLEGWGVNRLAQELGKPRSTIGDRVRALELDAVWLSLMDDGVLQISHAAVLHPYAAVPHEYQVKAAAKLGDGWRVKQALSKGEQVSVDDLSHDLFSCYRDYVVKLGDVRGYKGPVIEVKRQEWSGKEKFAADPVIWRPIYKRFQKAQKAKRASGSAGTDMRTSRSSWVDSLPEGVQERSSSEYYPAPHQGEVQLLDSDGWDLQPGREFDTRHVLANIVPSQLIKVVGKYSVALMTTDVAGVEVARAAFSERVDDVYKKKSRTAREHLERNLELHEISGPGVKSLAAWILQADHDPDAAAPADMAAALELADPDLIARVQQYNPNVDDVAALIEDMAARQTVGIFCSAIAASGYVTVELPPYDDIRKEIMRDFAAVNPKWPGAKGGKTKTDSKNKKGKKSRQPKITDVDEIINRPIEEDLEVQTIDEAVDTSTLSCIHCGCTDDDPCDPPCSWVTTDPAVCSACASEVDDEDREIARIKEFAARGRAAQAAVDDAIKDPDALAEEGRSEQEFAESDDEDEADDDTPTEDTPDWLRRARERRAREEEAADA